MLRQRHIARGKVPFFSEDVGHATVANRTAKGSICRISEFFAEIKAHHFQDAANLGCLLLFVQRAFRTPAEQDNKLAFISPPIEVGVFCS